MKKILFILVFVLLICSCDSELFDSTFKEVRLKKLTGVYDSSEYDYVLQPPQNPVASRATSETGITISWNAVNKAEKYRIYRRISGEENFNPLMVDVDGTSYTDVNSDFSPLRTDVLYEYRVTSFSASKGESEMSESTFGSLLSVPSEVSASKGESKDFIRINWKSSTDVPYYRIYVSPSVVFDPITSLKATYYADKNAPYQTYKYYLGDEINTYAGVNLYVKVTSVSSNGTETQIEKSAYDVGYTFVEGAPDAPENLTADQGVSTDTSSHSIRLSWNDTGAVRYIIYRYSESLGQKQIFPFSETDTSELVIDGETGVVSYEDRYGKNDIVPGERYTYTVIPIGEIHEDEYTTREIQGLPATADAYLLSNPADISVSVQDNPTGYVISFDNVVGLDTEDDIENNSDWIYVIKVRSEEGTVTERIISPSNYAEPVRYVFETDEKQNYYFSVSVRNSYTQTDFTEEYVCKAPSKVRNFNASRNVYISNTHANSNGVYPVKLTWSNDPGVKKYVISRYKKGMPETESVIAEVDRSSNSYLDENIHSKPGEVYCYSIYATDALDRVGTKLSGSDISEGYGVLTESEFVRLWTQYCLKPFVYFNNLSESAVTDNGVVNLKEYWKNSEIAVKVDKGNASSISTQMDALTGGSYIYQNTNYFHGNHTTGFGRLGYSADTEGIGGQIYFTYEDFGEVAWMYCNGSYEMHVNASGDGTVKTSGLNISGMYPAKILLDFVSVKSKGFSGDYVVVFEDGRGGVSVHSL